MKSEAFNYRIKNITQKIRLFWITSAYYILSMHNKNRIYEAKIS